MTKPSEVTVALPLQRNAGFKQLSTLDVNVKTTNSTWPPKVTVTVWLLSVESNTNGNADNWDGTCAALSGKKICAMVAGLDWSPRFRSMNRQNINTPGKNKTETKT